MFCLKYLKEYDLIVISFGILGMVALAFFLITIWPTAMNWVHSISPWYFLAIAVICLAIVKIKMLRTCMTKSSKKSR